MPNLKLVEDFEHQVEPRAEAGPDIAGWLWLLTSQVRHAEFTAAEAELHLPPELIPMLRRLRLGFVRADAHIEAIRSLVKGAAR